MQGWVDLIFDSIAFVVVHVSAANSNVGITRWHKYLHSQCERDTAMWGSHVGINIFILSARGIPQCGDHTLA